MFDIDKVYGFFYNQNKNGEIKSGLETKRERDNLKLDIIKSVWKHPNTVKAFLSGGNYDTLIKVSDEVKGKREQGENVESIFDPVTWSKIANRMLTGKALIGIAANAAAGHAVIQHANKLKLNGSFKFNNQEYSTLNQAVVDNTIIAKSLAEYVAAFVDNGKDPRAQSVNVNNYTVDVGVAMLLAGVDFETVHYFLAQEPLFEFVDTYLNLGGNNQALAKVKEIYGLTNFSILKHTPSNYNKETLKSNLGKLENADSLIKDFLYYKQLSSPVADLVQAIKQGENGLGPTLSDAQFRIDQIENTSIDKIDGAREFLNNKSLMQGDINNVLNWGQEWLINNAKLVDTRSGLYKDARNFFTRYKDSLLTVREIETINRTLSDYMIGGYFKDYKNIINTIPERLEKYKDGEYSNFISRLTIKDGIINFNGMSGLDNLEIDRIRETWQRMLHDPQTKQLALDLIIYSFYKSGFRLSPSSFSSLQPVYFYRADRDFVTYIKNQLELAQVAGTSPSVINNFKDQYIRHNYRSLQLPVIENAKILHTNLDKEGKTTKDSKAYYISLSNNQSVHKDVEGNILPYVKYRLLLDNKPAGKVQLFTLDKANSNEGCSVYRPTETLGKHTSNGIVMEEYTYNEYSKSQFEENKIDNLIEKYNNTKQSIQTSSNKTPLDEQC